MTIEPLAIDITEARRDLNSMGKRLASEPVIYVTRHGKKAFAFVDADHIAVMLETIEIMSNHVGYKSFQQSLRDLREGRLHDHRSSERGDVVKELG